MPAGQWVATLTVGRRQRRARPPLRPPTWENPTRSAGHGRCGVSRGEGYQSLEQTASRRAHVGVPQTGDTGAFIPLRVRAACQTCFLSLYGTRGWTRFHASMTRPLMVPHVARGARRPERPLRSSTMDVQRGRRRPGLSGALRPDGSFAPALPSPRPVR